MASYLRLPDGQGAAAYRPDMLLGLVLYCFSKGIRSSRRVEAACLDDVGCRIITAGQQVDHATVARFLRRHRQHLNGLFVAVLALCGQRGLVDLAAVAIDGSPMRANAAKSSNQTLQRLETTIAEGEAEIAKLMEQTTVDASSTEPDAGDQTQTLSGPDTSLARLLQANDRIARAGQARDKLFERALPSASEIQLKVEAAQRMVARAGQKLAAVTADQQARTEGYARRTQQDQAAGWRRANGRPPKPVDTKAKVVRQQARLARARSALQRAHDPKSIPSPSARATLTDPQSRLMLDKNGGYVQGYNIQIASARNQVLLAIELQDNPSDMTALVPLVRRTQANCTAAGINGHVQTWLADSGYASTANFAALADLPFSYR